MADERRKSFRTYSGADIIVSLTPNQANAAPIMLGELMAISYSTNRQKFPVRILGNAAISAFTKGPRTVAGTLVFAFFDEHALKEFMTPNPKDFDKTSLIKRMQAGRPGEGAKDIDTAYRGDLFLDSGDIHTVDDIPPFDITITFANEYGQTSVLQIIGAEFVDDGAVMSIQDLVTQNTISYVARDIRLMVRSDGGFERPTTAPPGARFLST